MGLGATPEQPIEMEDFDFEPVEDTVPRMAGMPHVPNPKPVGAAKVAQFKQLGTASGQKMSNFFQHPFTHLGVGILAGMLLADCLLYTSPSPRDRTRSRMPSSA